MLDGKIIINPTQNIINLKYSPKEPNPFSQQEIGKMQQEQTLFLSEKYAVLFNVVSGLRIGELLAIAWEDVDWNNREIKIQRSIVLGEYKQTKTSGSTRIVELDEIAMNILKEQFKITGKAKSKTISVVNGDYTTHYNEKVKFIFTNSKTRRVFKGAKEFNLSFFKSFLKKAEIKHRGADQLRHTFASHCLTAGINKSWIARQMGHESTEMIDKHYARWLKNDAKDYSKEVTRHLQKSFGLNIIDCPIPSFEPTDESKNLLKKLNQKPELMQLINMLIKNNN